MTFHYNGSEGLPTPRKCGKFDVVRHDISSGFVSVAFLVDLQACLHKQGGAHLVGNPPRRADTADLIARMTMHSKTSNVPRRHRSFTRAVCQILIEILGATA